VQGPARYCGGGLRHQVTTDSDEGGSTTRGRCRGADPPVESDLRQLARLNQVNKQVPLVLLEDGEVARFANPYFVARNLHIRALTAAGRAQRHFVVRHDFHLPPFTTVKCSIQGQTAAERYRRDCQDRSSPRSCPTHFCQIRERLLDVLQLQMNKIQDVLAWGST